ncbi:IclR family transcriptional regulator [Megasphaera paucivorans]|uniref:Glycerol operon regulatory protein n=1 Tax=Megasphaera paucivorans TaxID=349095 RepID=A0A1G9ZSU1_9FIRM|nr:IclR family transcriptional regulator [Megasphaera paucivorans]SDN24254.1 transcriptional regulator, IclR family [Megasphaera paucivorans]
MNNTVIQSLVKAIHILECFEDEKELGVTEISRKANLNKSTTFNIITTLEAHGFLEQNESNSKYKLGIELFRLGTKVNTNLRKIAFPYLDELVSQFKETVNFVLRDGDNVVYMDKVESPHSMRISTNVGTRLPLHITAVGKAILSGLPEEELLSIINRLKFIKYTDYTLCNKNDLMQYIKKVKAFGYAEDFEELEIGLTCVAAPIFNFDGRAYAAISISGPTPRMNAEIREKMGKALVEATQQISKKIGYKA